MTDVAADRPHGDVRHTHATSLDGWLVRLRPVEEADYSALYRMVLHPDAAIHSRFLGATPSPAAFVESLWQSVHVQFVIERRRDAQLVGLVTAYRSSPDLRFTYIMMIIKPEFRGRVWPLEAADLFLDHLFALFPLRKIYAEVAEFSLKQFATALDQGVVREEACLREHLSIGDRYWDLYVLAIHRSDWEERSDRVAAMFRRHRERSTAK